MTYTLFKDVIVESDVHKDKTYAIVENAITFIKNELPFTSEMKVHIILSNDYEKDVKWIHTRATDVSDDNGCFIPTYLQSEQYQKKNIPIIVINWSKLVNENVSQDTKDKIIASVIVHELVHYFDYYFTYSESIIARYGDILTKFIRGSREDAIGGIYQMRSEVRAKYFQEKYLITSGTFKLNLEHMSRHFGGYMSRLSSSARSKNYYTLAHIRGQLRCWDEQIKLQQNNEARNESETYLMEINKILVEFETKEKYTNNADLFDIQKFFHFCDAL